VETCLCRCWVSSLGVVVRWGVHHAWASSIVSWIGGRVEEVVEIRTRWRSDVVDAATTCSCWHSDVVDAETTCSCGLC
jgi:hypothetical protein